MAAQKTGRLILDKKTGELVEEVKEDQISIGLQNGDQPVQFRKVLRSKCTLKQINRLFQCNASYVKDTFGSITWPSDWVYRLLPETQTEKWRYTIVESGDRKPQNDDEDIHYVGATAIVLSDVPILCEEVDIRTYLLYGISLDYDPIVKTRERLNQALKKIDAVNARADELPNIDVDGTKGQQAELRKKLADTITAQSNRIQGDKANLEKIYNKQLRAIFSEPVELLRDESVKEVQSTEISIGAEQPQEISKNTMECATWYAKFTSPRAERLAQTAIEKSDWQNLRFLKTRPKPIVFAEFKDRLSRELKPVYTTKDLKKEINIRGIRIQLLKHGHGDFFDLNIPEGVNLQDEDETEEEDYSKNVLNENFHVSYIKAMYSGEYVKGKKHGKGIEYTNSGIYNGLFENDAYHSSDQESVFVYGKGDKYVGNYDYVCSGYYFYNRFHELDLKTRKSDKPAARTKKLKVAMKYRSSLLNPNQYNDGRPHGKAIIYFADGAVYEGEAYDGRITGYGKYISSLGIVREGYFKDGELNGEGKVYQISVENPSMNTQVKLGDFYIEGNFKNGVLHGNGKQNISNKFKSKLNHDSILKNYLQYEGHFENGQFHGRGKLLFRLNIPSLNKGFESNAICNNYHIGYWNNGFMQGPGQLKFTASDEGEYLYEGSFIDGSEKSKHRVIPIGESYKLNKSKSATNYHIPYTISGKRSDDNKKMTLLSKLGMIIYKVNARYKKNDARRKARETEYLSNCSHRNLTLYYKLLDEFYENWALNTRQRVADSYLSPEELEKVLQERANEKSIVERRIQMRKMQYKISPRVEKLEDFDSLILRISLSRSMKLKGT